MCSKYTTIIDLVLCTNSGHLLLDEVDGNSCCLAICNAVLLIQALLVQKSCLFRQVITVPAEPIVFTLFI